MNIDQLASGTFALEREWLREEDERQLASFRSSPPSFLLVSAKPVKEPKK